MSVISNNILAGSSGQGGAAGYAIERSLRFNSGDSAYLNRQPSSAGNRKTWTWSGWVKRSGLGSNQWLMGGGASGTNSDDLYFNSDDTLSISSYYGGSQFQLTLTRKFRDVAAWYHIVFSVDTTQATDSNRVKIYVNGENQTDFNTASYPALDFQFSYFNTTNQQLIGSSRFGAPGNYLDSSLADIHFIDGQALAATDFGEYDDNNVWQPIEYAGTYGTNGFKLNFSDTSSNSALGTDSSGQGNNWTVNNLSVAAGAGNDALRDSPVNGNSANDTGAGGELTGNYATWNPLFGKRQVLSNGNLKAESDTTAYATIASTLAMKRGKWYMEYTYTYSNQEYITWGISQTNRDGTAGDGVCEASEDKGFKAWNTGFYSQSAGSNIYNYSSSVSNGDIISLAFDADAGKLWVAKNGTWMTNASGAGNPAAGTNPDYSGLDYSGGYYFMAGPYYTSGSGSTLEANFGQRAFAYTAPSGYKCLNTANLPDPTIADGSTAFDVKLYTGNQTAKVIPTGFSPDFVWTKRRDAANNHQVYDSVRGDNEIIVSNMNIAEETVPNEVSFASTDGINIGSGTRSNENSVSYVAWAWDAGSSNTTIAAGSISSGVPTIASTVRANPSAGFSIVKYTGDATIGRTIAHGLNAVPEFIIGKNTDSSNNWSVYTKTVGAGNSLALNDTGSPAGGTGIWGNVTPTSEVFTVGGDGNMNGNGNDMIAYCFAPVEGYSAMGTYLGNGSSPPFVFTGFRPRFIMIKCIDDAYLANWLIWDSERSPYNVASDEAALAANLSDAEGISGWNGNGPGDEALDILSNGFKIRMSGTAGFNGNGDTYLYYAVAEHPFKTSRAR